MNSLILDQYNRQPLTVRILSNSLTTAGWCFWAYLWAPLFLIIGKKLGLSQGSSDTGLRMINELSSTLGGHLVMIAILIGLFIAWALLQELGKVIRHNSNQEKEINPFRHSPSQVYRAKDLVNWRQNKRIVVNYDDNSGHIKSIELADLLFITTDSKTHQGNLYTAKQHCLVETTL